MQKTKLITLAVLGSIVFLTAACSKKEPEATINADVTASSVASDTAHTEHLESPDEAVNSADSTEPPAAESKEQSQAIAALDQPSS